MTELAIRDDVIEGEIVDRDALLDSIAEYARWLQQAEQLVQAKSLEKAADLAALYAEGSWIAEWQEVEPAGVDALGKTTDPANRKRFARWLEDAERQRNNPAPSDRYIYALLDAHGVMSALPASSQVTVRHQGVTEDALRPLIRLRKIGYAKKIPEIWTKAVSLAEEAGEARVTQSYVKQARSEFMATLTPELQRQAVNVPRAQTLRAKAQAIVEDLWGTGNTTECKKFYDWFSEFLRTQQDAK